jgi:putative ABC transport system substrate-binding protein
MIAKLHRREFITVIGGSAAAWPLAARAQQSDRVRRIGVLIHYSQTDREGQARIAAFLDTLQRLGWTDGRNVRIEYRWSAGDAGREKASAGELVRSKPDVIVVAGWTALAELQRLTSMIPVVFTQVSDPVDSGFVAGLARPGANISGFQNFEPAMGGKWLGVLKEAAPNIRRAAVLFGSDSAATVALLRAAEAVAPALAVDVTAVDVHAGVEIERAIATFASEPDGGLIVTSHPSFVPNRGIDHPIGGAASPAGGLSVPILRNRGRTDVLRARSDRSMARGGNLRRSHSAGREAERTPGSGAGQVRVGNQPQDRQGDRIEHPASIAAPRRRGDRMRERYSCWKRREEAI